MQEVAVEDALRVDHWKCVEVVVGTRPQRVEREFTRVPHGRRIRVVSVRQTSECTRAPQHREQIRFVLRSAQHSDDTGQLPRQRVASFCEIKTESTLHKLY